MTDKEVMQMALDALTIFREWEMGQDYNSNRETVLARAFKAEETLRTALAQGEQEPVAVHKLIAWIIDECHVYPESADEKAFAQRLLAAILHPKSGYTAPPQREWQGLTDEEINTIAATPAAIPGSYVHSFARAIEAKLKEKNS